MNIKIKNRYVWKLLIFSFLATLISLFISAAISRYVPSPLPPINRVENIVNEGKTYSPQDLDEARKEFDDRIRQYKEKKESSGFFEEIKEIKLRALWVSWIPWLILVFILPLRNYSTIIILIVIPLLLVITGLVLPVEIVIISSILFFSIYIRRRIEEYMKFKNDLT